MKFLGIDCGTQGTKAVILDVERGVVLGEGSAPHPLTEGANGRREQNPADWIRALVAATRAALAQAGSDGQDILGVGVSGQQHGLVLLDDSGKVLRPAKLWCDTESTPENQLLLEHLGGVEGSIERLGLAIAPGYTVSKLLWTKEQHPEVFDQIAQVLLPHDYLNFWLTGRAVAEYGDASGTGYFNVRTRQYDLELLRHIDPSGRLERALPTLIEADQPVGRLRPEVASQLGINPQALVSSGGGDNMMGALGTGNSRAGQITLSLGTSGTLYGYSDEPRISDHPAVAGFCSSNGGWLPLICTMNLTNASGQIRELLGLDLAEFTRLVAESPIGAEGVLMLPFLNGERVPALPTATASLHGLTATNLTRANLCRAVVEGVSFALRYGFDLLRDLGMPGDTLRLIGGGAKSPVWRQLIADLMNTPVVCPVHGEAAALGGALQAAWCWSREQGRPESLDSLTERCVHLDPASRAEPDPARVAEYEAAYQRYRQQLRESYGIA